MHVHRRWRPSAEPALGPVGLGRPDVSTRKLIIAALVCGMVILLAGALQFLQIARDQHRGGGSGGARPAVTTTTP